MTDFRTARGIGARIKAVRKQRGFRTARSLAESIPGGSVTEAILQNIEAGRKEDLSVSQLLNIAYALRVAPGYLLAPMGVPAGNLDLAGLSEDVARLNVQEFDAWLAGVADGAYRWTSNDDRSERAQLEAMRALERHTRERDRLRAALQAERSADLSADDIEKLQQWETIEEQLERSERTLLQLTDFLVSSGWQFDMDPNE